MASLKIKYVGPIRQGLPDGEVFQFQGVTVFTGSQGSGKSTAAKIFSSLTWLEKALVRGDIEPSEANNFEYFKTTLMNFHGLAEYFNIHSVVEYQGKRFSFILRNLSFEIQSRKAPADFASPKIMYVPAERNFLAAIDKPEVISKLTKSLKDFLAEYLEAKEYFAKHPVQLELNNTYFSFEEETKRSYVSGDDFKIDLLHASSGYQSYIPMFLVTRYLREFVERSEGEKQNEMSVAAERRWLQELSRLLSNKQMNDKQKIDKATELMQRYTYSSFINIVEEPEQNLYPTSQKQALFGLLSASNGRPDNRLLLTTHSPYIISYLNISLEAAKIYSSLNSDKSAIEKKHRVSSICPQVSAVNAERVNTYEFKSDGSVSELGKYDGVLQDANQLNNELDQLNSLFSDLLEI